MSEKYGGAYDFVVRNYSWVVGNGGIQIVGLQGEINFGRISAFRRVNRLLWRLLIFDKHLGEYQFLYG